MVSSKGDVVGERNSGTMLGLTDSNGNDNGNGNGNNNGNGNDTASSFDITFTPVTDASRGSRQTGPRQSGSTETNPLQDFLNLVRPSQKRESSTVP